MNPGGTEEIIKEKMTEAMANYGKPGSEGVTIAWNLVQQQLHCCGVEGKTDWDKRKPKGKDSCWRNADCKNNYAICKKGIAYSIKPFGLENTVACYQHVVESN